MRYASRFGTLEQSEDAVQDGFLELYRELRLGARIDNPAGWLMCATRRKMWKIALRAQREQPETGAEAKAPDAFPALEMQIQTRELCAALTTREEEVLFLRLGSMKYKEIAAQLGISSSSVNTLLARAIRKLQQAASRESTQEGRDARRTSN